MHLLFSSCTLRKKITAIFLFSALAASAQSAWCAEPPAPQTMTLNVQVTDRDGRQVTGLEQKDFTLLDNKAAVPITNFKAVNYGQEPVHVILVVDNVNVPFTQMQYVRNELDKFLRAQQTPLPYPTTVAIANQPGMQIANGFTRDAKQLAEVLKSETVGLRPVNDTAGGNGAAQILNTELKGYETLLAYSGKISGRKIIVWFAPGWPLLVGTRDLLNEVQKKLVFSQIIGFNILTRNSNVTLYNINPNGLAGSVAQLYRSYLGDGAHLYQVEAGDLSLQVQTTRYGGLVLNTSTDIGVELAQVYDDIKSWYEISFTLPPGHGADEFHRLDIKMGKSGLKARTDDTFYLNPTKPVPNVDVKMDAH